MTRREVTIVNQLGLHARAATRLVKCASGFEARVMVARDGREVNAKSIMGVLTLAAAIGTKLELIAEGPDENEALDALEQLIRDRFGEEQ